MRHISTVVFALAAGGLFAAAPAQAQDTTNEGLMNQNMVHSAGGPIQMGSNCWVSTNSDMGFGYWTACEKPAPAAKRANRK
ncbi:MAG TPA: hypothetical protein VFS63_02105 [Pseudolabrys sp.]|jgi:hypothetical protein|nr:hypothetical protein [Pseudolabrys sp.]